MQSWSCHQCARWTLNLAWFTHQFFSSCSLYSVQPTLSHHHTVWNLLWRRQLVNFLHIHKNRHIHVFMLFSIVVFSSLSCVHFQYILFTLTKENHTIMLVVHWTIIFSGNFFSRAGSSDDDCENWHWPSHRKPIKKSTQLTIYLACQFIFPNKSLSSYYYFFI